jgi:hypothetical protein
MTATSSLPESVIAAPSGVAAQEENGLRSAVVMSGNRVHAKSVVRWRIA